MSETMPTEPAAVTALRAMLDADAADKLGEPPTDSTPAETPAAPTMDDAALLAFLTANGIPLSRVLKAAPTAAVLDDVRERKAAGEIKPKDLAEPTAVLDVLSIVRPTLPALGDGDYTITVYRPAATENVKEPIPYVTAVSWAAVTPVPTTWDSRLLDVSKIPASRNVVVKVRDGKAVEGAATTARVSAPGVVREIPSRGHKLTPEQLAARAAKAAAKAAAAQVKPTA
jgi:hypothetical protein